MQITSNFIESLLFHDEGPELDFKRDQYRFDGAGKQDKSELLKDILAFTNTFRRSDAYILIGVKEVKGRRSIVTGVACQLDDAKLQQFVNSKTQRPTRFSYREAEHDGLPIGIIHIPLQRRPVYTTADYGIVKKGIVYIRHGSATNIASADEIAQMGAEQATSQNAEPSFELTLFERTAGNSIGEETLLQNTWLELPKSTTIPDYREPDDKYGIGVLYGANRDYYRNLVEFTQAVHAFAPVSLAIRNAGSVSAHDVRLVFEIDDPDYEFVFMEDRDIPAPPKTKDYGYLDRISDTVSTHSDVYVSRIGDKWQIECSFGKIQPQDTARLADDLYVGAREDGTLIVNARVYADNISAPQAVRFTLHFETESKTVSLEDIKKLEMDRFLKTEKGKQLFAEMDGETEN